MIQGAPPKLWRVVSPRERAVDPDRDPLRRRAASEPPRAVPPARPTRARRPGMRRRAAVRRARARWSHRPDEARLRRRSRACPARSRCGAVPMDQHRHRIRRRGTRHTERLARLGDLDDGHGARSGRARLPREPPPANPSPGGRAYRTTVFKKPWAWYFRKHDGELLGRHVASPRIHRPSCVPRARDGLRPADRRTRAATALVPVLDPLLFRPRRPAGISHSRPGGARRAEKVPIPGYFGLELVVER